MLSLSVTAQTKRAIVIGLGEQQDKAWNKINGDKDVPLIQAMLKNAGFKSVTTLVNRQATKVGIVRAFSREILGTSELLRATSRLGCLASVFRTMYCLLD